MRIGRGGTVSAPEGVRLRPWGRATVQVDAGGILKVGGAASDRAGLYAAGADGNFFNLNGGEVDVIGKSLTTNAAMNVSADSAIDPDGAAGGFEFGLEQGGSIKFSDQAGGARKLSVDGDFDVGAGQVFSNAYNDGSADSVRVSGTANMRQDQGAAGPPVYLNFASDRQLSPSGAYAIIQADGKMTGTDGVPVGMMRVSDNDGTAVYKMKNSNDDSELTNFQQRNGSEGFYTPELVYTTDSSGRAVAEIVFEGNGSSFVQVAQKYGLGHNARELAHALDDASGSPLGKIIHEGSAEQIAYGLTAASGNIHASERATLIEDSYFLRDSSLRRLDEILDDEPKRSKCDPGRMDVAGRNRHGLADVGPNGCKLDDDAWSKVSFWEDNYGSWGHNGGGGAVGGLNRTATAFHAGADAPLWAGVKAGALVSYGRNMLDSKDGMGGSAYSNNVSVGAYGGKAWNVGGLDKDDAVNLKLGADYTFNLMHTSRTLSLTNNAGRVHDHMTSRYDGGTAQAYGEVGYKMHLLGRFLGRDKQAYVEPVAQVAYVNLRQSGYTEKETDRSLSAALHGRHSDRGNTFSAVGFRCSQPFTLVKVRWRVHGMALWRHTFGPNPSIVLERFANPAYGAYQMSVWGASLSRDTALANVGLEARLAENLHLGLNWLGRYGDRSTDTGITGGVKLAF